MRLTSYVVILSLSFTVCHGRLPRPCRPFKIVQLSGRLKTGRHGRGTRKTHGTRAIYRFAPSGYTKRVPSSPDFRHGPMISPQASDSAAQAAREKRWVALSSLLAAVLLTTTKLVVGLWTNSLGILSEAAHSGLDLVAAAVTLWAVRVSGRPADRDHTYGHGKFENLSALFETLLLLLTCVWIIYEAVQRLVLHRRRGRRRSEHLGLPGGRLLDRRRLLALAGAAAGGQEVLEPGAGGRRPALLDRHLVVVVVFFGLVGVLAAERFEMPWLVKADAVAALGVAAIVVWVSLQLGKKSVDDLLDRVPRELRAKALAAVQPRAGRRGRRQGPRCGAAGRRSSPT